MIHAPSLMPDEDARGYWGRVLRLNSVSERPTSEAAFLNSVRARLAAQGGSQPEQIAALSCLANAPMPAIVSAHTTTPFVGAVLPLVGAGWCDDTHVAKELRRAATKSQTSCRSICPACAAEDIDFWGFSYWRRSHQVPYIMSCSKHDMPLFRAREISSWQTMPLEDLPHARPDPDTLVTQAIEAPVLRRYADVCAEQLNRSRPISTLQAVRALTIRARAIGLSPWDAKSGRKLSDLATDCISAPWQVEFARRWQGRGKGPGLQALDATLLRLRGACDAPAYALAIALLWDSVDDAINALIQPLPPLSVLLPFIDREAQKPVPNERPRDVHADLQRQERLRRSVALVLDGRPLQDAADAEGWAAQTLERMLTSCITADELPVVTCA